MTTEQSRANGPVAADHQLVVAEMQKQLAKYEQTLQNLRAEPEDDVIDLRELWNVLVRRRWTVIIVALVVFVSAIVATASMTPIYRATTTVQIERESTKVVEFDDILSSEGAGNAKDFYETQYELLRSRNLARRVIDQLGLYQEGAKTEPGVLGGIKQFFGGFFDDEVSAPSELEQGNPRLGLENAFLGSLTVEPVRNSRLVRLNFDSPNPAEAALVVNTLASAYVDMTLDRRFEASTYAKGFLEDRLKQIRADLEDAERRFLDYSQERGIISQEDKLGVLAAKLQEFNSAAVQAETSRIRAEAQYQEMLGSEFDSLAPILDSVVIQNFKQQLGELQSQYQGKGKIYKPAFPLMQQLSSKIAELEAQIVNEVSTIRNGIQLEYQSRLREEAKLQESIVTTRQEILSLEERSTDFTTLKREVDTNRELYDGLLQRMKEVGVAAGIADNNISVVDRAPVPNNQHSPRVPRNLALGLLSGLFAGVGLAFLFEMLDDTLKTSETLEKLLGKPVLGVIPAVPERESGGAEVALMSFHQPTSAFAEAYRSMRTSLMFSTAQGAPKVLHFTSAGPGEGKTTTAVSIAINFAQTGANVLLVDADLRNPSLHKLFNAPNHEGLSNYLSGAAEPASVTQPTGVKGLFLMTSGPVPPNPAELLHGARMVDLASLGAKRFDYMIIDSPPLLGLADALILGDVAQASLLVVAANSTRKGAVEAALKRLSHSRANVLGSVMTKFDFNKSGYGYGYGYDYQYTYSYGASPAEPAEAPRASA